MGFIKRGDVEIVGPVFEVSTEIEKLTKEQFNKVKENIKISEESGNKKESNCPKTE